ncbi:TPA_asm: Crp/Fnr family transcriptional regulator [Listeria monocytogenes]|nr:Crp/Fnr family transcriptional regulator [Listeria monocytogenes]
MTFLELHDFLKKDLLIYTWITNNIHLTFQKIEKGETLTTDRDHLIIMKSGAMVQESEGTKNIITRCFFGEQILFTAEGELSVKALETTEYSVIQSEDLFSKLEEENLLPNFFLQLTQDLEIELKKDYFLTSAFPNERINMVLDLIIKQYQISMNDNTEFPRWLKVNLLAKLSRCSISTTSAIINELNENGRINIKSSPWILTEESYSA